VVFANMYEKDTGFTQATTKLRSGGAVMTLMSVTNDLLPPIDKEGRLSSAKRAEKDLTEQADWTKWQMRRAKWPALASAPSRETRRGAGQSVATSVLRG
jgi:hypothetical protein